MTDTIIFWIMAWIIAIWVAVFLLNVARVLMKEIEK